MQESEGLRWPCPGVAGAGSRLASVDRAWLQLVEARGTRRQSGAAGVTVRVRYQCMPLGRHPGCGDLAPGAGSWRQGCSVSSVGGVGGRTRAAGSVDRTLACVEGDIWVSLKESLGAQW